MDRYGITIEQMDQMRAEQQYQCFLCGVSEDDLGRRLDIDHCHATGTVRKMLCNQCNIGLGAFKDNVDVLLAAVAYLSGHQLGS